MKQKCFALLLVLTLCQSVASVVAQQGSDTTFLFYFNTAYTRQIQHNKRLLKHFLKTISNITALLGFTDTAGPGTYNKKLAQVCATYIHQLLPTAIQNKN